MGRLSAAGPTGRSGRGRLHWRGRSMPVAYLRYWFDKFKRPLETTTTVQR